MTIINIVELAIVIGFALFKGDWIELLLLAVRGSKRISQQPTIVSQPTTVSQLDEFDIEEHLLKTGTIGPHASIFGPDR